MAANKFQRLDLELVGTCNSEMSTRRTGAGKVPYNTCCRLQLRPHRGHPSRAKLIISGSQRRGEKGTNETIPDAPVVGSM